MELILKTDVRASVPEIIEFNYEELQAYLGERLEKYRTLVVAEDGIKAAKSDRAALNKLRSALEDSRKGVKADCLRPYESFEVKIKALTGMIEGAIQNIDTQVKGFEEAKKQEKRAKIEAFFAENIGNLADSKAPGGSGGNPGFNSPGKKRHWHYPGNEGRVRSTDDRPVSANLGYVSSLGRENPV